MPERLAKTLEEFSHDAATLRTVESVLSGLQAVVRPYDIEVFAAGFLPADATQLHITNWRTGQNLFFGPTIPADYWPQNQQATTEMGWDAISIKAQRATTPFTFAECAQELKSHHATWIFDFLQGFDIADGFVVPLRLWNLVYRSPQLLALSPAMRSHLSNGALVACGRMEAILKGDMYDRTLQTIMPLLTPREREVLQERTRLASNGAIAQALNISPKTVDEHLRRVRQKLGTSDTAIALLEAFKRGLITF